MGKYILRRIAQSIVVLFGALVISFVILRVIPGDPAQMMLSDLATPDEIARVRTSLGVDQPLWVQFNIFEAGGNRRLRRLLPQPNPALGLVLGYLPATLQLAAAALRSPSCSPLVPSRPCGRKLVDNPLSGFALIGQSVPVSAGTADPGLSVH